MFSLVVYEDSRFYVIDPMHPKPFGQVAISNLSHQLPQEVLLSVGKVVRHLNPPCWFFICDCMARGTDSPSHYTGRASERTTTPNRMMVLVCYCRLKASSMSWSYLSSRLWM